MAWFHRTVFLGYDLALFLPDPNWRTRVSITHRLATEIETGQTARENRRPRHHYLRHELAGAWTLKQAEAAELQQALYSLGTPTAGERVYVGMPMFPDQLTPARWGERIYDSQWVINYDETGYTIHAADTLPDPATRRWFAPLLVGRLQHRPTVTATTDRECRYSLKLVERSPWDFRVAPAAEGAPGADWPAALEADWKELPQDSTVDGEIFEDMGAGRVEALEGQEAIMRRRQQFLVTMRGRAKIRTLLNFFLARKGSVQSFTAPWLLQPGADTEETPHSTKVRFADDALTLEFSTDQDARAKVATLQVPWEIDGVEGETPAQESDAYFYKFWLDVPGGPVAWRFTNWEHDLVRAGDGTYKGDVKGLFQHDKISQSMDFSEDPTTISSWIFADNPLLMVTQRLLDVPMQVEIRRGTPGDPDAAEVIYLGEVDEVPDEGRKLTATTKILGGALDAKLPDFNFGSNCNYEFCGAGCLLDPEDWTFTAETESLVGNDLTVQVTVNPPAHALVDDYFARGWMKKGTGAAFELKHVVRSVDLGGGRQKLTLKRPLRSFAAGVEITLRPYCSGTRAECEKYGNYINYGGHPHIGSKNLSLPVREINTPTSKK